eukprot:2522919-Heterocapsa_arctica.AAC.1
MRRAMYPMPASMLPGPDRHTSCLEIHFVEPAPWEPQGTDTMHTHACVVPQSAYMEGGCPSSSSSSR